MIKMNQIAIPHPSSDFLKTAWMVELKQKMGSISYVDFTYDETEQINLVKFEKAFEAKDFKISSNIDQNNLKNLKNLTGYGIDAKAEILSALIEQDSFELEQKLYREYLSIAKEQPLSDRQKLVSKIFAFFGKEIKFPSYVGKENSRKTVLNIIMTISKLSNMVYSNNRRGPANFVVVSPEISAMLQDSSSFVYKPHDVNHSLRDISIIGSISGLTVFVNLFSKNKDEILVGRATEKGSPGMLYATLGSGTVYEVVGPDLNNNISINFKRNIVSVGFFPERNYMKAELSLTDKPFWRRLIGI